MTHNERIKKLRKKISEHDYRYFILDAPTISNYEYDRMMEELAFLEKTNRQTTSSKTTSSSQKHSAFR